jgi:predicted DNA-binding protein
MAPPKKRGSAGQVREYKIRLPLDVSERIEAKAKKEQRPQNRIIINELAAYPQLEEFRDLSRLIGESQNTLARYASEIVMHQLSGEMLNAVDTLLKAEGGAVPAAIERVRVLRNDMRAHEQATKRK